MSDDEFDVVSEPDLGTPPDAKEGYQPGVVTSPKWREILQRGANVRFTDAQKSVYLRHLARFGRTGQAAAAARVSRTCVRAHTKEDPIFAEACREAMEDYADRVRQQAYKVAIEGVSRPIFGGQFKDQVVGHEIEYDTRILGMELKRVDEGYRDKSSLDVNVAAGVLLIPAVAGQTPEERMAEWEAAQEKAADQRRELAETTPAAGILPGSGTEEAGE